MLRDIARDIFTVELGNNSEAPEIREELEHGAPDTEEEAQRMIIPDDEDDGMMLLTSENLNRTPGTEEDNAREKR